MPSDPMPPLCVRPNDLAILFRVLHEAGYTIAGPTVRDGAILYEEIQSPDELPIGWTDEQEGGTYRLKPRGDNAYFGYVVGPHSWKKFFFPPRQKLWEATRDGNGFQVHAPPPQAPRYALIGVRSCELHAIAIQDKVYLGGPYIDPIYRARREGAFLVAVQCGLAGRTCFCASMKTGPRAESGYDLAITELLEAGRHEFLFEAGSERGAEVLGKLPHRAATQDDQSAAQRATQRAIEQMGRHMDRADEVPALLQRNLEHPRWKDVAERCLTCANCTMVCPTCFCATVEDVTDLTGEHAERWRRWDSCFTMDFSYLHGGSVRSSALSRYRQWMTHKLSTWHDQFDTSGCVGCGRCITWCPVGIDLTEEVRAIRASDGSTQEKKEPSP